MVEQEGAGLWLFLISLDLWHVFDRSREYSYLANCGKMTGAKLRFGMVRF